MSLKARIDSDLKTVLLAEDRPAVTTLRGLKAAILDAEVAANVRETGLSDEDIQKVVLKEIKKRQESIDLYKTNNRPELAKAEQAEIDVLQNYAPKQLSEQELKGLINTIFGSFPNATMQDIGKIIGEVKTQAGNAADGGIIAKLVKEKLQ
jgi:uncharacterized protein YqeY